MSGAKYTSETQTFTPVILPAVLGALITCGTEAVAQAGRAVEMEQIIRENCKAYDAALAQQRQRTAQAMQQYELAMRTKIRELEQQLHSAGVAVPAENGASLGQRIQQLTQLAGKGHSGQQITHVFLNLKEMGSAAELFRKITDLIDPILPEELPCCGVLLEWKTAAAAALKKGDTAEIRRICDRVSAKMSQVQAELTHKKSLKETYDRELARAKALHRITKTLAPYPVFTLETAEQAIIKLKEISVRQFQIIDRLRQDPVMRMSPEDRLKAQALVSNRICAALADTGVELDRVSEIGNERVCWYRYGDAMLKVSVADTGFVSFEVVGHPDKRSGFKKYDENRVLEAMERFRQEFPQLQQQLEQRNVSVNVLLDSEPCAEIVRYEQPMTDAQYQANQAAVLAMLNNVQQAMAVGGDRL